MKRAALVISCFLFISACSGSSETGSPSSDDPPSADDATAVAEDRKAEDATAVAEDLKAEVGSVQEVVEVTEDNDPNNMIGRPNGYVTAAVIYDSGLDCGEDLGVGCGATVEVWPSAEAAKERSEYILGLLEDSPILGSEYNYLDGATLLRVSGELKPTVAKEYEAAFANG